jgi:hypothetical protein
VVGSNSREDEVIIRIMGIITMDGTKIAAVEVDTEEVEVTTAVVTGAGLELYTPYVELMYAS